MQSIVSQLLCWLFVCPMTKFKLYIVVVVVVISLIIIIPSISSSLSASIHLTDDMHKFLYCLSKIICAQDSETLN